MNKKLFLTKKYIFSIIISLLILPIFLITKTFSVTVPNYNDCKQETALRGFAYNPNIGWLSFNHQDLESNTAINPDKDYCVYVEKDFNKSLIARVGWSDQDEIKNGIENGDTIVNTGGVTRNSSGELVWNTGDAKQFLSLENQSIEEGESVVLIGRFARGLDETYPNLFSIAVGTNNNQIVLFVIEPNVSVAWLGNNGSIIGAVNNSLVAVGDYYIGALQVTRTAAGIEILVSDNGSTLTGSSTDIPFSTSNITFNIGGRNNSSDQSWDGKIKDVVIAKRDTPYTESELSNLTPEELTKPINLLKGYAWNPVIGWVKFAKNYSTNCPAGKECGVDLVESFDNQGNIITNPTPYLRGSALIENNDTWLDFSNFSLTSDADTPIDADVTIPSIVNTFNTANQLKGFANLGDFGFLSLSCENDSTGLTCLNTKDKIIESIGGIPFSGHKVSLPPTPIVSFCPFVKDGILKAKIYTDNCTSITDSLGADILTIDPNISIYDFTFTQDQKDLIESGQDLLFTCNNIRTNIEIKVYSSNNQIISDNCKDVFKVTLKNEPNSSADDASKYLKKNITQSFNISQNESFRDVDLEVFSDPNNSPVFEASPQESILDKSLIARVGWSDQDEIKNGIENGDTIVNTGGVTRNSSGELVWNTGDAKQFLSLENQSIEEGESVVLIGRFARGLDETYPNLFSIAVGTNNNQIVLFVIEPNVSVAWLGNNGSIIGAVNNSLVAVGDYYIGALQVTRTAAGIEILVSDNGSTLTGSSTDIPFSTSNITFNIGGRNNSSDQSWDGKIKDVVIAKRDTPFTENELSSLTPEELTLKKNWGNDFDSSKFSYKYQTTIEQNRDYKINFNNSDKRVARFLIDQTKELKLNSFFVQTSGLNDGDVTQKRGFNLGKRNNYVFKTGITPIDTTSKSRIELKKTQPYYSKIKVKNFIPGTDHCNLISNLGNNTNNLSFDSNGQALKPFNAPNQEITTGKEITLICYRDNIEKFRATVDEIFVNNENYQILSPTVELSLDNNANPIVTINRLKNINWETINAQSCSELAIDNCTDSDTTCANVEISDNKTNILASINSMLSLNQNQTQNRGSFELTFKNPQICTDIKLTCENDNGSTTDKLTLCSIQNEDREF